MSYLNTIDQIINWLNSSSVNNILIITGKTSFINSGASQFLEPVLNKYNYTIFSDFSKNIQVENVKSGLKQLKSEKYDCCVSIGGGSSLDMGKLLCLFNENILHVEQIILGGLEVKNPRTIPLLSIPTTSGSGAEATHFAVVYNDNIKYSVAHNSLLPDIVYLNPDFSFTLSSQQKAICGLDALTQAIESYWSLRATNESREFSLQAVELIWNNLPRSVNQNDFDSHKKVFKGSHLAGKAINIAKTTACHALSYYFSINYGIKHGHAVSLTLGSMFEFNLAKATIDKNIKKYSLFKKLLKVMNISDNPKIAVNEFISNLGIEIKFEKLGIDIIKIKNEVIGSVNVERLKNNPYHLNENDLEFIILNN